MARSQDLRKTTDRRRPLFACVRHFEAPVYARLTVVTARREKTICCGTWCFSICLIGLSAPAPHRLPTAALAKCYLLRWPR